MEKYNNNRTYHKEDAVLCNWPPVVTALVGKRTGCTEHFDNRNEAKDEEDDPDNLVPFEYAF